MLHRIYGQHLAYMFETPTTQVWKQHFDAGRLKGPQTHFWETKPAEELYDLQSDPDEVKNLAASPEHQKTLQRLRGAQQALARKIRDVGFLPEGEIHSRSEGTTPYEMARDERKYPLERIMATAELAASTEMRSAGRLKAALQETDSAVRYWAATGFLIRGKPGVTAARSELRRALSDPSAYVRIVAAEALGKYGAAEDLQPALAALLELAPPEKNGIFVSLSALNAVDELDRKAASALPALKELRPSDAAAPPRTGGYVPRVLEKIMADLE
jgi:uncharacterized sulfatase